MTRVMIANDNLTANSTSSNLLAGNTFEFVTQESDITLYAASNASGIKLTVLADSDIVVDDQDIVFIDTTPKVVIPDYLITQFTGAAGTRLIIRLRETGGVSTTDTRIALDIE